MKKAFAKIIMLLTTPAMAQKTSGTVQQVWLSYHNQVRFSNRWGLWNDAQLRTKNKFTRDFSVYILRTGLVYLLNAAFIITPDHYRCHFQPMHDRSVSFFSNRVHACM